MDATDAPTEQVSDRELAETLAAQFGANELRRWMSENGLERSRGANKMESAMQAVEQNREGIAAFLLETGALDLDWRPECRYHGACGNRTAGQGAEVCDECMDAIRANDRSDDPVDREGFASADDYMGELLARHS